MQTDINETLGERGSRYGNFGGHAAITQALKDTYFSFINTVQGPHHLNDSQKEAVEMIFHKLGRIANGDPNYADSWHDIAGYATLVDEQLQVPIDAEGPEECHMTTEAPTFDPECCVDCDECVEDPNVAIHDMVQTLQMIFPGIEIVVAES